MRKSYLSMWIGYFLGSDLSEPKTLGINMFIALPQAASQVASAFVDNYGLIAKRNYFAGEKI